MDAIDGRRRRVLTASAWCAFVVAQGLPVVHFRFATQPTFHAPGIYFLLLGFLHVLWGNPAWFGLVPLALARRSAKEGRARPTVENAILFAALSLWILVTPFTDGRALWGSTTWWDWGATNRGRHTRVHFEATNPSLASGAPLLTFAILVALYLFVAPRRRLIDRSLVVRTSTKYLGMLVATSLLHLSIVSEAARYARAAVPGIDFLLMGALGPFVGQFGWYANIGAAMAWWGVLAESEVAIRRAAWITPICWLSCVLLFVFAIPGDDGEWNLGPSFRIGFAYWTAFLASPFACAEILRRRGGLEWRPRSGCLRSEHRISFLASADAMLPDRRVPWRNEDVFDDATEDARFRASPQAGTRRRSRSSRCLGISETTAGSPPPTEVLRNASFGRSVHGFFLGALMIGVSGIACADTASPAVPVIAAPTEPCPIGRIPPASG